MLRLTSGAYTFLQRCYAAIYKRAWFKGLAAAVVLPAAIVIPQIAVADDAQQKVTLDGTTTVSEEDSTLSEWNGTEIESGQYGLGRVGGAFCNL